MLGYNDDLTWVYIICKSSVIKKSTQVSKPVDIPEFLFGPAGHVIIAYCPSPYYRLLDGTFQFSKFKLFKNSKRN